MLDKCSISNPAHILWLWECRRPGFPSGGREIYFCYKRGEVFQVVGGGWERWFLAANWGQSRPQRPHPCLNRANIFSLAQQIQLFASVLTSFSYIPGSVAWILPEKPFDQRAMVTADASLQRWQEGKEGDTKGAISRFLFLGIFQLSAVRKRMKILTRK